MKKFLKNQIKNILSVSSNRKGISLEKIKKSFPYEYHKDKIELLLNEDKDIIKNKSNLKESNNNFIYSLKDEYIKSKKFELIERRIYNLDYLYSLFKETEIINIFKLIKDHDKITYQKIVNYLSTIYNMKKDIKQVSHYCLILLKLNQILSYQPVNVEKFNKINIIANSYLKFQKENLNSKEQNNIQQNTDNHKLIINSQNNKLNTFQLMTQSLIIDDSEIKNTIMFHLYLNKEKEGVSANELYIACDFIRRGKILNKIITYMENESTITHKALRKGKIMEFLYHISDENKVSPRIKYLANTYKKIIDGYNNNETKIKKTRSILPDKEGIKEFIINKEVDAKLKLDNNSRNKNENGDKIECIDLIEVDNEDNSSNKKIVLESEVLNKEDYNFILTKMKELGKKIIQESEDTNSMRKNIINYISSIEKNRNVSLSSYNRYIFILNILYDKKVLSFVEIKHHISNELEKNKEFMIDRKTIRRLLNTLEKIGLIKIVRYELTMRNLIHKYLNSKEEIKQEKIIVVHRDVDINDKIFQHQANEKLRNNKKPENKFNLDDKEIKKIKKENNNQNLNQIVNNVIDKNNDSIKINLKGKLFIPIYNVLKKIENKNKIDIKKVFEEFIKRLKRNFCNTNFIYNLYNQKDKENEIINKYKNDNLMENFYEKNNFTYSNILKVESQNYSNIIIPKYILNKYSNNDSQNIFIENTNESKEKTIFNELENPFYSIKSKYFMDKQSILLIKEKKENDETNKTFLGNKRYRFSKLKDNSIDNKNLNRTILINDILNIICNIPGITIKTLRKLLLINSQNFCLEKNIITYMINIGLIYAQDFDQKNLEVVEETKLYPHSEMNLYI